MAGPVENRAGKDTAKDGWKNLPRDLAGSITDAVPEKLVVVAGLQLAVLAEGNCVCGWAGAAETSWDCDSSNCVKVRGLGC